MDQANPEEFEGSDVCAEDGSYSWSLITDEFVDAGRDLSAEELLGEDFEREAFDIGSFTASIPANSYSSTL